MFSMKKKSLTRLICTALTFMSVLPFGVARAGNTVKVTDDGPEPANAISIYDYKGVVNGEDYNTLTLDLSEKYNNYSWYASNGSYGSWCYPRNYSLDANNNQLVFENGTANFLWGGYTYEYSTSTPNKAAYSNTVTIKGGTVNGSIYGGNSNNNNYNNVVNIINGTVKGDIYGGCTEQQNSNYLINRFQSHDNTVNISGGTVMGNVFGGRTFVNSAKSNHVNITGGTITGKIYGAYGYGGAGNTVTVDGGTVTNDIYGVLSTDEARESNVYFKSGTLNNGSIFGGYSTTKRSIFNTVNISGGTVMGDVFGGKSVLGPTYYNSVNISGGTVTGDVFGGESVSDSTYNNSVNISGGTVTGKIYGGYDENGHSETDSRATYDNTITISGGTVSGSILGGYSDTLSAAGSTITVKGSDTTVNSIIYGNWSNKDTGLL